MKRFKRLAALVLTLAMTLTMLPLATNAAPQTTGSQINVTVKFDASAVADDLTALKMDMITAGMVPNTDTSVPTAVTVTVKKGATVQQVLAAAQKKSGFTIEGLDSAYVTKVGFISNESMSTITSIPVGDYNAGNIFSMAGWTFGVNGADLMEGIDSAKVTANNSVVTGTYHLVADWSTETNSMVYGDTAFLTIYKQLQTQTTRKITLTSFTETEKDAYQIALAGAKEVLEQAYNEAVLTKDMTVCVKGGMWIGLYETQGTKQTEDGSLTQSILKNIAAMKTALAPQDKLEATLKTNVKATKINTLTLTKNGTKRTLTWKKTGTTKLDGYEVFRSTKRAGTYTKVATVTTAKYTMTQKAANKNTYYVKVRGYRTINGVKVYTGFSIIKMIK